MMIKIPVLWKRPFELSTVISIVGKPRKKDCELKAKLDYIVSNKEMGRTRKEEDSREREGRREGKRKKTTLNEI